MRKMCRARQFFSKAFPTRDSGNSGWLRDRLRLESVRLAISEILGIGFGRHDSSLFFTRAPRLSSRSTHGRGPEMKNRNGCGNARKKRPAE